MSIFGRRENTGSAPPSPGGSLDQSSPSRSQQRRITHIAPGSRIEGQVSGPTELLVEGEVEGEIRVDSTVMIGTEGVVQGPVTAHVVRIGGRVFGNVTASDRIEVAPSGSLEGDAAAPRIIIAEGAFFKGRVEMTGADKQESKPEKEQRQPQGSPEPGKA
ncbi:MAG TPA: polymer-forming cytoskeletal protein [Thermoanaerobaculia bacterium]|nr:polymer-forming cytoskeletal protein [Thermoanaerobaculia bacterium]